eukprot:scaffold284842_cov17-Prasinocladus_malaysianus.AAC.1
MEATMPIGMPGLSMSFNILPLDDMHDFQLPVFMIQLDMREILQLINWEHWLQLYTFINVLREYIIQTLIKALLSSHDDKKFTSVTKDLACLTSSNNRHCRVNC